MKLISSNNFGPEGVEKLGEGISKLQKLTTYMVFYKFLKFNYDKNWISKLDN